MRSIVQRFGVQFRFCVLVAVFGVAFTLKAPANQEPPQGSTNHSGPKQADRVLSPADAERLASLSALLLDKGASQDDRARRARAARALGLEIGHRNAIIPLRRVIEDATDHPYVRREALAALSVIADKSVVPILIQALADDHPQVRERAADQLMRLSGETLGMPLTADGIPVPTGRATAVWEQWWRENEPTFTFNRWSQAATSLGVMAADRVLEPGQRAWLDEVIRSLLDYGEGDSRSSLRRADAARTLGEIGHRDAIPALKQVFEDTTLAWELRYVALTALSQIPDKSVVPVLIQALGDREPNIFYHAVKLLQNVSGEPVGLRFASGTPLEQEQPAVIARWQRWWRENREWFVFDRRRLLTD